jgi:CRISPR-associated exonuclease Cas4
MEFGLMNDFITVTDVVENTFCEKFTYFSLVLNLKQYEEKRGVVIAGKDLHLKHEKTNRKYLPLNMEGKKIIGMKFFSKKLHLSGKIDEAIETEDEVILIERKYTDYAKIGNTIKVQLGLLAILISENLNKPVNNAIVIFSKKHTIKEIVEIDMEIKKLALKRLEFTKNIVLFGLNPSQQYSNKCINCCYRKICPVGSLYTD